MIKNVIRFGLKFMAAVCLCAALFLFCQSQTKGFRAYFLLSNLPNDPRWEMPPLKDEQLQAINTLLDQPFTFLGSGGWCYAFLGQDQKTVLKFYKHTHLSLNSVMRDFSFGKLLLKSARLSQNARYFQEFNFTSCALLMHETQDRTGVLYAHLNKTHGVHKSVTLYDNIGVQHTIDLDQTEFVVQKNATLLLPYLSQLAKEGDIDSAKACIDDLLDCLLAFYQRGIKDHDRSFRNNFGVVDGHVISLDLSSFGRDEMIAKPANYKKEIVLKTQRLKYFLEKNHPDLWAHYESRLCDIVEDRTF